MPGWSCSRDSSSMRLHSLCASLLHTSSVMFSWRAWRHSFFSASSRRSIIFSVRVRILFLLLRLRWWIYIIKFWTHDSSLGPIFRQFDWIIHWCATKEQLKSNLPPTQDLSIFNPWNVFAIFKNWQLPPPETATAHPPIFFKFIYSNWCFSDFVRFSQFTEFSFG